MGAKDQQVVRCANCHHPVEAVEGLPGEYVHADSKRYVCSRRDGVTSVATPPYVEPVRRSATLSLHEQRNVRRRERYLDKEGASA